MDSHAAYELLRPQDQDEVKEAPTQKDLKWCQSQSENPPFPVKAAGTVVIVTITLLVLSNVLLLRKLSALKDGPSPPYYLETSTGTWPGKQQATFFNDDPIFTDPDGKISDPAWAALFPSGNGGVQVDDRMVSALGLTTSVRSDTDPTKSIYGVSAFHQIHCLASIRSFVHRHHFNHSLHLVNTTEAFEHVMHCINVLRWNVMCRADSTLMARVGDNPVGDGEVRTCNNFDALKQWSSDHAYIEPEG